MSHVQVSGKRVAIIGAGPAGLGCADILVRNGVAPVVFDRHERIGGLLTFGIPPFKLEKEVVEKRREIMEGMGVQFRLGVEIGTDLSARAAAGRVRRTVPRHGHLHRRARRLCRRGAAGRARGAAVSRFPTSATSWHCPARAARLISMRGKRVVVLGGGDTAMDCNRTAMRQGAESVTCTYRRDERNMPGSRRDYRNSREEGVEFLFNRQPIEIVGSERVEGREAREHAARRARCARPARAAAGAGLRADRAGGCGHHRLRLPAESARLVRRARDPPARQRPRARLGGRGAAVSDHQPARCSPAGTWCAARIWS